MFPLAAAASEKDIRDFDPLFMTHDTLDAEIEGPFSYLTKERPDEEEVPGKFRFRAADSEPVELEVDLRTRGKNRRDKKTCEFPPMRLDFKKSQTKNTVLHKQDKLKLVTHCDTNSAIYEQAVIKEYLAYRALNLLTDSSFRVRLLRVSYIYTDADRRIDSYGILIEDEGRLGKRLDAKPVRVDRVKVSDLRPDDLNLTSIFQFLLANTDFSPVATAPGEDCCHNQALFAPEQGLHFTVPYDFDRSGWVDAPHATPNPRFKLKSVTQRLYRGRCANNDRLDATLDLFRERRDDIEALLNEHPELSTRERKKLLKFCEKFYRIIDSPGWLDREVVTKCI